MRRTITSAILSSSLLFTAAAYASPSSGDTPAPTRRVSTGITPPKLLGSLNLTSDQMAEADIPADAQIAVAFVVDQQGQTRDIRVVHGYDPIWDARAVDAVSRLHYRPASLDNQSIPMSLNLVITLTR